MRLTAIDSFSKLAVAYPIEDKTPGAIWEGVLKWCVTYVEPEETVSDCGWEFDNALIKEELNTPYHVTGRGVLERLHKTLGEHHRLLKLGRNLDP